MPERTAAEVLAEKLIELWETSPETEFPAWMREVAARLAEDPAITVRTDMVVERYVVEIHEAQHPLGALLPWDVFQALTVAGRQIEESPDRRIIVRPYPEEKP